jgi:hypothetical protein
MAARIAFLIFSDAKKAAARTSNSLVQSRSNNRWRPTCSAGNSGKHEEMARTMTQKKNNVENHPQANKNEP